jgi:flavin reductase (DIM6/NTAB) family NADH-FMN oxidoreductase RutF
LQKVESIQPYFNDNKEHTVSIVVGRILKIHIHKDVLTEESRDNPNKPVVDWKKLRVIGRLGGSTYTEVDNGFDLVRPNK